MGIKIKLPSMHDRMNEKFRNELPSIDDLLAFASDEGCSDLYVKVGEEPYLNRYGKIYKVPCMPVSNMVWEEYAKSAISSERNSFYVREKHLDFAYQIRPYQESKFYGRFQHLRYRVSAGYSLDSNTATFRMISPELPSFKSINFPEEIAEKLKESFQRHNGIIMLSGATGSGKTTTMAACVNDFTKEGQPLDNSMIVTLEDPIEYVYQNTDSVRIMQKELGVDFMSFDKGIEQALREHPNAIIPGEIRNATGINTAVNASQTGHKVMTSFHASDVAGVVSRLYSYLGRDREDAMYDLIANLDLIIVQRLISDDTSFSLQTQFLEFTYEIKELLQEAVENNRNVSVEINKIMRYQPYLDEKIAKDWS